jgi:hypothetical protein
MVYGTGKEDPNTYKCICSVCGSRVDYDKSLTALDMTRMIMGGMVCIIPRL